MSLEAQFIALVEVLCTRVYPDFAPNGTSRPYVTYQQIGGQAVNHLDRVVPNKRNANVQVNVYADTRKEASELIQSIEDAVRLSTVFQGEPNAEPVWDSDADIPEYWAIQDFSIWADR